MPELPERACHPQRVEVGDGAGCADVAAQGRRVPAREETGAGQQHSQKALVARRHRFSNFL